MDTDLTQGMVLEGQGGKRWKVDRPLGSGRCCRAHRVTMMSENVWGALKIYNEGAGYRAARDREAQLLSLISRTNHSCPQIVELLDKFDLGGRPCLVESLLDANITQLIYKNQDDGLSLYVLQKLTRDLLIGVSVLHQLGFVHGDIKPENILWNPQYSTLALIDFSISFHVTDQRIGSLQSNKYRAPEVERWNKAYTASLKPSGPQPEPSARALVGTTCDMWSIGCVFAEMFLGRKLLAEESQRPAQGVVEELNIAQVLVRQLVKVREDEDEEPDTVELLSDLIHRCLYSDPFQRITAKQAVDHPFFSQVFKPSYLDLLLLPTCIIRLMNLLEDQDFTKGPQHLADVIDDIIEGCRKYGPVKRHLFPKDGIGKKKVYVEYVYYTHSMDAFENLAQKTFNERTVLLTFFPREDYEKENFY